MMLQCLDNPIRAHYGDLFVNKSWSIFISISHNFHVFKYFEKVMPKKIHVQFNTSWKINWIDCLRIGEILEAPLTHSKTWFFQVKFESCWKLQNLFYFQIKVNSLEEKCFFLEYETAKAFDMKSELDSVWEALEKLKER